MAKIMVGEINDKLVFDIWEKDLLVAGLVSSLPNTNLKKTVT